MDRRIWDRKGKLEGMERKIILYESSEIPTNTSGIQEMRQ